MCQNTNNKNDICNCMCHQEGVVMMHIMACCNVCPHCKQNIKTQRTGTHEESCNSKDSKTN